MSVRNYNSPSSFYNNKNIYSADSLQQWELDKEKTAVKCDTCDKKCLEVFIGVIRYGVVVNNYCSKNCWGTIKKL